VGRPSTIGAMVKARLHDGRLSSGRRARVATGEPVCCDPCADDGPAITINPTITVKMRQRDGYTDEGDKRYVWFTVVEGEAILWDDRTEVDGSAGLTAVSAEATILYDGHETVDETAVVLVDAQVYRVTSVAPWPDRLVFQLVRSSDADG